MKSEMKTVTESQLVADVLDACCRAAERGTSDQQVAEHLFLAAVMRVFIGFGEEATETLLRAALRDVGNGNFAKMLEEAGFIEWVSAS